MCEFEFDAARDTHLVCFLCQVQEGREEKVLHHQGVYYCPLHGDLNLDDVISTQLERL